MYESFFGFVKRPFLAVSTLDRYFPATSIEQTFQTTARAIQRGEGPVAIFGGTGLGKTMCCLRIAENFRRNFEVVMLASSQLITRRALLQSLLFELRMPYRDMSEGELRLTLMNRLQPSTENPSDGLVLVVDEAQTLSMKLLEELRLLTNVVRNGLPRVRMVLCGTMRLEECLSHPMMDSLNQRLAARCYLTPLSLSETAQYVRHKIELSGVESSSIMTRDALDAIYRGSDGIPRLIDQLADQALMLACHDRERPVSAAMVGRAWCMLQQLPNPWSEPESLGKSDSQPLTVDRVVGDQSANVPTQISVSTTNAQTNNVQTSKMPSTSNVEFGQLDDELDQVDMPKADMARMQASRQSGLLAAFAMDPALVPPMNSTPSVAPGTSAEATPPVAPPAASPEKPSKKNLLDVFAGDFDEEFTIPVQSSDSYQAYSGVAYGNLNHDLSSFGSMPSESLPTSSFDIEEANDFLSNPFAIQSMPAAMPMEAAMPTDYMAYDQTNSAALESAYAEPVSNISPEQAANLERQIEEEMRELVSGLNMNAMTFDPSISIDTLEMSPSFQQNAMPPDLRSYEQKLAQRNNSDVIAFTSLHGSEELYGQHNSGSEYDRAAMNDDRDLLVIEDEIESVRNGAQQAATTTNRAVLHPYAKLFTKLRNS